jgi:hypothetical protein
MESAFENTGLVGISAKLDFKIKGSLRLAMDVYFMLSILQLL